MTTTGIGGGLAAAGLLLLTGCVNYYAKPGATADEFEVASAECQMGAAKIRNDLKSDDYYRACLRAKGWRQVRN